MYLFVSGADEEFRIDGKLSDETLLWLRSRYGDRLAVTEREGFSPSENLVYHRKLNKLSQVELAEKLGTQKQGICDLEHGRRAISKRMAKSLSALFGTDVSLFI